MSNGHPSVWWSQVFAVLERLYGVGENQSKIHDSLSWVLLWLHLTVTCSHPHCYPDQWPVSCCMDFSALHRRCVAPESVQTLIFSNCKTQQSGACRIQRSTNRLQQLFIWLTLFQGQFLSPADGFSKKKHAGGEVVGQNQSTNHDFIMGFALAPSDPPKADLLWHGLSYTTMMLCSTGVHTVIYMQQEQGKSVPIVHWFSWMITSSSWCRGFGGPLVRVNIPKSLRLWLTD